MKAAALRLSLCATASTLFALQASAQTEPPALPSPTAPPGSGEIVVTANKRTQNINDVGLTITAISGNELSKRGITSLSDVAAAVPGLNFAQSTANTPIFTLRGVGFNEAALGVYPAVSVYLDEAPLPFPVMASHSAYDLERIEALKGPQGTLFGQNSTGGAINYIAAKPTDTFSAGGDASFGRFNDFTGNAYISGPITENLKTRIAITGEHSDDWQRSTTRDDTLGKRRWIAGRALYDWQPGSGVHIQLNLNGWIDKSDPQGLQYVALVPQIPAFVSPTLANAPFAPQNARAADWNPVEGRPYSDRRFGQAVLRGDFDISQGVRLTSLTSYDTFKQRQNTDGDGLPVDEYDLYPNNGRLHSFNQEVRLANADHSHLRWVVGGNYEKSRAVEHQVLHYGAGTNDNPFTLFIDNLNNDTDQRIRNLAVFGNAEYDVLSNLTIKGGVRYTDSRRHASLCNSDTGDGHVNTLFTLLGTELSGSPVTPIQPGQCITLTPALVPEYTPFEKTLHEHNVSWRVGADYKLRPGLLFYANVSRGYKAGSFPTVAGSREAQLAPVTQESVTAYETGFKATLFDRTVQIDGAAFYYDYRDKQVRSKIIDPVFGILDLLSNVPKSRIYGAEIEATVRPIAGLTLSGGGTYLNSKTLKYSGANLLGQVEDFRGTVLPFTPKWSYTASVDYRFAPPSEGAPFLGATVSGRSSEDAAFDGSRLCVTGSTVDKAASYAQCPYHINGYATLDLRAGYEAANGAWRVMLWGKNVTNKYYWNNVIPASDTVARFAGQPATYGVTIGFKM